MVDLTSSFTSSDVIFVASGFAGMVFHYIKKWARSETSSSMSGYFGKDNVNATMVTLGAFCMAVIGALGAGVITPEMNFYAVIYAGLTMGFAVDSGFNKGSDPEVK
jgi:hypothetical protein